MILKKFFVTLALLVVCVLILQAKDVKIVDNSKANSFIVVADQVTPAAKLAAFELQYWINKVTGVNLEIVKESDKFPAGIPIFVGNSSKLPVDLKQLKGIEYQVKVAPEVVVLRGIDEATSVGPSFDYGLATANVSNGNMLVMVQPLEAQGTLKAVYDFIENELGVRFYGPKELSIVYDKMPTLSIKEADTVREPSFKHFTGSYSFAPEWVTISGLYGNPTAEEGNLFLRRMRFGGIKWYTNHTMYAYQKRFCKEFNDPMFEADRPEFFPPEGGMKGRQLCYSSDALVEQVAKDAIDYFSGKQVPGVEVPLGSDYFPIVPNDAGNYCRCERCKPVWSKDTHRAAFFDGMPLFGSGQASNYWFAFVNKVAKKVKEVYPDKYISTLAYEEYSYPPEFALETNIAAAPCLTPRFSMMEAYTANDQYIYDTWTKMHKDGKVGPIFLWNYYCFPDEVFLPRKEVGFPGFSASRTGEVMKNYAKDGVVGIFFCGIGEQLDFYMISRAMNNADFDTQAVLGEFFDRYFGNASKPMRRFYDIIEQRYGDADLYKKNRIENHQTLKIAWEILGTKEVMTNLQNAMNDAQKLAKTPEEKARVALWNKAVWEPMKKGSEDYVKIMTELKATNPHKSVAKNYIANIDANASWQYEISSYSLTTGKFLQESPAGVLGSKNALFECKTDVPRPWSGLGRDGTWVEFDLGAVYELSEIRIWNYQQGLSQTDRGMRKVIITGSPSLNFSDWREIYSGIIPRGIEGKAFPASLVINLAEQPKVKYIRITSQGEPGVGNWGNTVYSSLGQVRFYGEKIRGNK